MTREETGINDEVLDDIRRIILEEAGKLGVEVERIILFGSRARGDARPDSDYDILIILEEDPGRTLRRSLARNIRWRLAQLSITADIIIIGIEKWKQYSKTPGTILYPARQEGITIG